jgi:hypothetical protein
MEKAMQNLTIRRDDERDLPAPLRTSLTAARTALIPINPKELAAKLERTLALWPLPANWSDVAEFYREALADVPADLVDHALRHVRRTSKFFPKPAELREPIAAALKARTDAQASALRNARIHRENNQPREKVSPAQRAKNIKILEEATRILTRASKGAE